MRPTRQTPLEDALYAALILSAFVDLLDAAGAPEFLHRALLWVLTMVLTIRRLVRGWKITGQPATTTALIAFCLMIASPGPSAVVMRPRPAI